MKDSKEPFVTVQFGTICFELVEFVTVLFNVKRLSSCSAELIIEFRHELSNDFKGVPIKMQHFPYGGPYIKHFDYERDCFVSHSKLW